MPWPISIILKILLPLPRSMLIRIFSWNQLTNSSRKGIWHILIRCRCEGLWFRTHAYVYLVIDTRCNWDLSRQPLRRRRMAFRVPYQVSLTFINCLLAPRFQKHEQRSAIKISSFSEHFLFRFEGSHFHVLRDYKNKF